MTRMASGAVFKALARSPRSGKGPCVCDHTVSLPSCHCASAQLAPSEAWAWKWRRYSAVCETAAGGASAFTVCSTLVSDSAVSR